jgi:hypothetical protein
VICNLSLIALTFLVVLKWNNYGNERANPIADKEIGDWDSSVMRDAAKH